MAKEEQMDHLRPRTLGDLPVTERARNDQVPNRARTPMVARRKSMHNVEIDEEGHQDVPEKILSVRERRHSVAVAEAREEIRRNSNPNRLGRDSPPSTGSASPRHNIVVHRQEMPEMLEISPPERPASSRSTRRPQTVTGLARSLEATQDGAPTTQTQDGAPTTPGRRSKNQALTALREALKGKDASDRLQECELQLQAATKENERLQAQLGQRESPNPGMEPELPEMVQQITLRLLNKGMPIQEVAEIIRVDQVTVERIASEAKTEEDDCKTSEAWMDEKAIGA